jgi:hypothetical protein
MPEEHEQCRHGYRVGWSPPNTTDERKTLARATAQLGAGGPLEHGPAIYAARSTLSAIDGRPRLLLNECELISPPQPPSQRLGEPEAESEENIKSEQHAIYPNPSNGHISIYTTDVPLLLTIADASGRVCMRKTMTSEKTQLELGQLERGMYIAILSDEHGSIKLRQQIVMIR